MELLYVPDPTVIVKWALPPTDAKEAERSLDLLHLWLEGGCEFLLPPLWLPEVGSLLTQLYPERSADLMELLIGYRMPEACMTAELCRETTRLTQQHGVAYYPAVYHAVALLHNGTLITADTGYYRKAKAAGRVQLLKDFSAA